MPKDDSFTPEEKIEADLLAEDFTGQPVNYGSTAKAISELEKRIAHLTGRVRNAECGTRNEELLRTLHSELRTAQADLANYRKQQEGKN